MLVAETVPPVIESMLAQSGLITDASMLVASAENSPYEYGGTSRDDAINYRVYASATAQQDGFKIFKNKMTEPYTLNGLLTDQELRLVMSVPKDPNTAVMQTVSSPMTINQLFSDLGRQPGEQGFRLTRHENIGEMAVGGYIRQLTQLRIPVADLSYPETMIHDLRSWDHIQSWLSAPPWLCLAIARRARQLEADYGDQIDLPKSTRPLEVTNFVAAVDKFANVTSEDFRLAHAIGRRPLMPITVAFEKQLASETSFAQGVFRRMGILEYAPDYPDLTSRIMAMKRTFVGTMARVLLTVEEMQPAADLDAEETARRKDGLAELIKAYPDTLAV